MAQAECLKLFLHDHDPQHFSLSPGEHPRQDGAGEYETRDKFPCDEACHFSFPLPLTSSLTAHNFPLPAQWEAGQKLWEAGTKVPPVWGPFASVQPRSLQNPTPGA